MMDEFNTFVANSMRGNSPDERLRYIKVYDDIYVAKLIAQSLFGDDTNQATVMAIAGLYKDPKDADEDRIVISDAAA